MSFKGITWGGNVYQKFEAMCLEVEEAMFQDTVKYVENQVQKVGVSVKKFYSEVMDDMRPLSCMDPTSVASDDMSLISYGYADFNKKPIPGILDDSQDVKKNENQDQFLSNITAEKGDVGLFLPQSPGIFIENKSPDKCKKIGVQRRAIGIKRISKSNHPSKESCRTTSASQDRSNKVASCDTRISSRVASDNTNVTSSLDFDRRCETVKGNAPNPDHSSESPASDRQDSSRAACDNSTVTSSSSNIVMQEPGEAVNGNAPNPDHPSESPASDRQDSSRAACDNSTVTSSSSNIVMQESGEAVKGYTALQDSLIESPASEKALSAESTRLSEDVSNCIPPASDDNLSDESARLKGDTESTTSCSGSPMEPTGASVNHVAAVSSFRRMVCNLEYEEKRVTMSNEGTSIKDCSSSAGSPSCNAELCNKDFIMTNKDSFDIEFVENDEVSELSLEKFETDNGRHDLEGSCIFVEGDEPNFDLQGSRKHKSYKKRIREALSSKLRSRKDEQLVFSQDKRETSGRVRGHACAVDSEKQILSACNSVESDWELL